MKLKKTPNKLLGVERTLNVYTNSDNEPVDEKNVDIIPLSTLKKIFPPKEDDPDLYDGYILDAKQLQEINNYIQAKIQPNFEQYFYVLECSGIYDNKI